MILMTPKPTSDKQDDVVFNIMGSPITVGNIQTLLSLVKKSTKIKSEGEDDLEDIIENYFDTANYSQTTTHYEDFESSIMRLCAYQVIKRDYNIDECWFIKENNYGKGARKLPPLFENCVIKDSRTFVETKSPIPRQVTFFCSSKTAGEKWVFHFNTWDDGVCELGISTSAHHGLIKEVLESIEKYFVTQGPLKGGCFNPQWNWVSLEKSDWSALVVPAEIKEALELNIVNFIKNLKLYEEHGLSTSRGILLSGPPGTGKTLTMEVLLNEFTDLTRIYAPAETLSSPGAINDCYELARKLSPSIVIIEDIDTLGQSHDASDRSIYVSQLLSSLNSVESNKGVITIASTNYPESLDIALRDRPGRFDSRIEFPMPNKEGRESILLKYAKPFKTDSVIKWSKWAEKTDNFSGAWLRELVTTAFSLSVQDRKGNNTPVLNQKHMVRAFDIVQETREKANAVRSSSENTHNLYH